LALEQRISQATKMLTSFPVDDNDKLICESSPLHVRWASEVVDLSMVQDIFDLFPYKHSKKPILVKCKKEFISLCLGFLPRQMIQLHPKMILAA
jgi:hypothetical protein